jgi:hypothetical protein
MKFHSSCTANTSMIIQYGPFDGDKRFDCWSRGGLDKSLRQICNTALAQINMNKDVWRSALCVFCLCIVWYSFSKITSEAGEVCCRPSTGEVLVLPDADAAMQHAPLPGVTRRRSAQTAV